MMAGLSIIKKSFVPLLAALLLVTSFGAQPVKAEGDASAPSIYYVASGGDDSNPGTEALPWKTVTKAAETLVAGDTVYIESGTYNERVMPQNSGSPGNYITYTAYPGDTVTIDGTGVEVPDGWGDGLFALDGKDYIRVLGLGIRNSSNAGCSAKSSCKHIMIKDCSISVCQSSGIFVYGGADITIDNNEVTDVCRAATQEAITLAGGAGIEVDGFEIKNNYIHHNPYQEGIDTKNGCRNGKIYGNHVHDIPAVGIYVDAYAEDNFNIEVFGNEVHGCGEGIDLATEAGGTLDTIRVYNNVAYNNVRGFAIWNPSEEGSHLKKNITVINNTFYGNPHYALGIWEQAERFENLVVRNNIFSGDVYFDYLTETDFAFDHNLFTGDATYYGGNAVEADPKFIDPFLADFHLLADSPAIDSGSPIDAPSDDFSGNSRPKGAGYDIGAYEVGNSDVTPPVISSTAISDITSSSATISWSTDEPSTSQVDYGPTENLGLSTDLDTALVTSHSVTLTGLTGSTTYHYKVKSKDATGNLAISSNHIFETEAAPLAPNNPPNTPSAPSPANHATGIPINVSLSWSGGDPDAGDAATYDVYFGSSATPALVSNGQAGTSYDPGTLSYDTKYYWKIAATDNHGAVTEGDVWDFTTASPPPSTDTMWAESITFTPTGSELQIKVKVVNSEPVTRARVRLNLKQNGRSIWNGYGTTNSAGEATYRWRRATGGEYLATITYLRHSRYTWDESQGVTSASYTLGSESPSTDTMWAETITFTPTGSELQIKVKVVNSEPVARARVRLNLKQDGRSIYNGYGTTNSAGEATYRWRRATGGEYLATVTYLRHSQYTWDESQGVTSASYTLGSESPSTDTMWAESITFTPTGSELQIKVKVVNSEPVTRARVRLNLKQDGRTIWNSYGTTNSAGEATYRWRRATGGEYLATITYLRHSRYTWDESQGVTSASYTLGSTQAVEETSDIVYETATSETTNSV